MQTSNDNTTPSALLLWTLKPERLQNYEGKYDAPHIIDFYSTDVTIVSLVEEGLSHVQSGGD